MNKGTLRTMKKKHSTVEGGYRKMKETSEIDSSFLETLISKRKTAKLLSHFRVSLMLKQYSVSQI